MWPGFSVFAKPWGFLIVSALWLLLFGPGRSSKCSGVWSYFSFTWQYLSFDACRYGVPGPKICFIFLDIEICACFFVQGLWFSIIDPMHYRLLYSISILTGANTTTLRERQSSAKSLIWRSSQWFALFLLCYRAEFERLQHIKIAASVTSEGDPTSLPPGGPRGQICSFFGARVA